QPAGVAGKTLRKFFDGGIFAQLLAQAKLREHQLKSIRPSPRQSWIHRQISFGRNSFARLPALLLVHAENRHDLRGRQAFLFREELPDVGTLALTPEVFQPLGGTELIPGISRSRRGHGLELTHDAISHRNAISHRRPSVDVVGLIFLRSPSGFGSVGKGFTVPASAESILPGVR